MDKTALQFSGLLWTLTDHLIGFIVSMICVHLVSKAQKNDNYKFSQAVLVAIGVIAYSFIVETVLPKKFILPSLFLTFAVCVLLCKYICRLSWKKGLNMGAILFFVSIVVSILEGIIKAMLSGHISPK